MTEGPTNAECLENWVASHVDDSHDGTLLIIETTRRAWRCFVATTSPENKPILREVTEVVALATGARGPTRGLGEAPIKIQFGQLIAANVAKASGRRIHVQVIGGAEQQTGWVESQS
jgi:hypothetical protein